MVLPRPPVAEVAAGFQPADSRLAAPLGAARAPSPDVRGCHRGIRSLHVRGASASCLRLLP